MTFNNITSMQKNSGEYMPIQYGKWNIKSVAVFILLVAVAQKSYSQDLQKIFYKENSKGENITVFQDSQSHLVYTQRNDKDLVKVFEKLPTDQVNPPFRTVKAVVTDAILSENGDALISWSFDQLEDGFVLLRRDLHIARLTKFKINWEDSGIVANPAVYSGYQITKLFTDQLGNAALFYIGLKDSGFKIIRQKYNSLNWGQEESIPVDCPACNPPQRLADVTGNELTGEIKLIVLQPHYNNSTGVIEVTKVKLIGNVNNDWWETATSPEWQIFAAGCLISCLPDKWH